MTKSEDGNAGTSDAVVVCELKDGVAELTLNRPERLNAFTPQMGVELVSRFRELDEDDSVRAIIVTGAGRAFCAGADLAGGEATFKGAPQDDAASETEAEVLPKEARAREIRPWRIAKPIIAAINGPAVGVGLTLCLQWDMRIVAEDAKLS
ncbi:MAG: enoyl-CoA hydratase, partial [bacterium]|nr:enoyl-CoA hydratase [bacterium]